MKGLRIFIAADLDPQCSSHSSSYEASFVSYLVRPLMILMKYKAVFYNDVQRQKKR